jgi:hypothetical protein
VIEIDDSGQQPTLAPVSTAPGTAVADFVKDITKGAGLLTEFFTEGDEVLIKL